MLHAELPTYFSFIATGHRYLISIIIALQSASFFKNQALVWTGTGTIIRIGSE
jgi:hypothetical protein